MSQPLKRILVVVRRDQPELYAAMRQRYRDVAVVILDRRHGGTPPPASVQERRQAWTVGEMERWRILGYRLIYRATGIEMNHEE